jgi:hypothetical protein
MHDRVDRTSKFRNAHITSMAQIEKLCAVAIPGPKKLKKKKLVPAQKSERRRTAKVV